MWACNDGLALFLQPAGGIKWKTLGIGEVVDANRMASTSYKLSFRTNRRDEVICEKTLNEKDLEDFRSVRPGVDLGCRERRGLQHAWHVSEWSSWTCDATACMGLHASTRPGHCKWAAPSSCIRALHNSQTVLCAHMMLCAHISHIRPFPCTGCEG